VEVPRVRACGEAQICGAREWKRSINGPQRARGGRRGGEAGEGGVSGQWFVVGSGMA